MSQVPFNLSDCVNKIAEKCDALPPGWCVLLEFANREVTVMLLDPNGDNVDIDPDDRCHIREAIETAERLAPDFIFEADRCERCRGCGMVTEWVGSIPGDLEMNGADCPDCGGTGKRKDVLS